MKVLIIGEGGNVLEEVAEAKKLGTFDVIIATNEVGMEVEKLDHLVSYHAESLPDWDAARVAAGLKPAEKLWTGEHRHIDPAHFERFGIVPDHGGSSGMLAVQVALELGKENPDQLRIVLAGVPLDPAAGNYKTPSVPWTEATVYRPAWEKRAEALKKNVRSMSGWTAELFGKPTAAWLQHGKEPKQQSEAG